MKNTSVTSKSPHGHARRSLLIAAATAGFVWTSAMAGEAQLSVANVSVSEGNSGTTQMNFSVVRSGDTSSNIVVPYSVPPGTAAPKNDYVRPANNTLLRIPAGFKQGIVSVPVNGDTKVEPNETLQLQLGQPAAFEPEEIFRVAPTFDVGNDPTFIATADFDADGRPDLAVANSADNTVSILLGVEGKKKFLSAKKIRVGSNPQAIVVADFNGDGKPDIAVANQASSDISIVLGTGDGRFGSVQTFPTSSPVSIASADFNGDGRPDLVTASQHEAVSVLINTGGGAFDPAVDFNLGGTNSAVVTADFNGDGRPDLAVAKPSASPESDFRGRFSILLGDGAGGFVVTGDPRILYVTKSIITADFNGDTMPDLAFSGGGSISVLLGNGDGTFGDTLLLEPTYGGVLAPLGSADFDGDGNVDLVTTADDFFGMSKTITILLGDGTGAFNIAKSFNAGNDPRSLAIADFDGDGRVDIAAANRLDNEVAVLRGSAGGSFDSAQQFPVDWSHSVVIADINADGASDLVSDINNYRPSVRFGDGQGNLSPRVLFGDGNGTAFVAVSDLNNDRNPDVVTADRENRAISILLGDGSGALATARTIHIEGRPVFVAPADFNGDGIVDLAVASDHISSISILIGQGNGRFNSIAKVATSNGPIAIVAADFNGDGRADLAVANSASNNISILLSAGTDGQFLAATNLNVGGSPDAIATADLNGDGRLDLAVANAADNNLSILLGDGNGGFAARENLDVKGSPRSVAIADVNGDGRRDLIVGRTNYVSILSGNGDGSFGLARKFRLSGTIQSIALGDLNGDGKRDLAVADTNGLVSILLNSPGDFAVLRKSSAIGTIINDD